MTRLTKGHPHGKAYIEAIFPIHLNIDHSASADKYSRWGNSVTHKGPSRKPEDHVYRYKLRKRVSHKFFGGLWVAAC